MVDEQEIVLKGKADIKEFNKLLEMFDKINKSAGVMAGGLVKVDDAGKPIGFTFNKITEAGDKLVQTYKKMNNGFELSSNKITLGTNAFKEQAKALKENAKLENEYYDSIIRRRKESERATALANKKFDTKTGSGFGDQAAIALGNLQAQAIQYVASGLKQGAKDAIEFERALYLIQQQSGATGKSTIELGKHIFALSEEFNLPATDIAAAQLSALRGQMGDAGKAEQVLRSGLQLGRLTFTDSNESVKLLNETLNAYSLDARQAERVSAILYSTVKNGTATLSEFGEVSGEVGAVAAPLGVKLEEISALFQELTRRGIPAGQVGNQLAQVFTRLNTPTEDTIKAFRRLGVETFTQLIQSSGGTISALQRLQGVLKDTGEGFNNVFGGSKTGRPGSELTSELLKEAIKDLDKLTHAQEDAAKAGKDLAKNVGQELKDALTTVENKFLKAGDSVVVFLGKLSGGNSKGALGLFTNQLDLVNQALDALNSKLGNGSAGSSGSSGIVSGLISAGRAPHDPQDNLESIKKKSIAITEDDNVRRAKEAADTIYKNQLESINKHRIAYFKNVEAIEAREKDLTAVIKNELKVRIERAEDDFRKIRDVQNKAKSENVKSQQEEAKIKESIAEGTYKRNLQLLKEAPNRVRGGITLDQFQAQHNEELKRSAKELIEGGPANLGVSLDGRDRRKGISELSPDEFLNNGQVELARKKIQEYTTFAEEKYQEVFNKFKEGKASEDDLNRANYDILDAKQKELDLEKAIQDVTKKKEENAKKLADAEELRIDNLKSRIKEVFDFKFDDANGKPKFTSREDALKAFDVNRSELAKNLKGQESIGILAQVDAQRNIVGNQADRFFGGVRTNNDLEVARKAKERLDAGSDDTGILGRVKQNLNEASIAIAFKDAEATITKTATDTVPKIEGFGKAIKDVTDTLTKFDWGNTKQGINAKDDFISIKTTRGEYGFSPNINGQGVNQTPDGRAPLGHQTVINGGIKIELTPTNADQVTVEALAKKIESGIRKGALKISTWEASQ